ncbi:MAG: IclR family transcriptional regulator [Comamonas sp.]
MKRQAMARDEHDDENSSYTATPTVRLFLFLEAIARLSCHFTLQEIVNETGMPKPSVHRVLQQLEAAGIVQRDGDDRHYVLAPRMRRIANDLLLRDSLYAARHAVLRDLREAVGESCNLTSFQSGEVLYLDRVETMAPLRFFLQQGSRVPAHCSATGKLFLSQLAPRQQKHLVEAASLERYTPNTIVTPEALYEEVAQTRKRGYGIDNEEFLHGLVCFAVLVPSASGLSNLGVAMQGPSLRLPVDTVDKYLPALRKAAEALARLEGE